MVSMEECKRKCAWNKPKNYWDPNNYDFNPTANLIEKLGISERDDL